MFSEASIRGSTSKSLSPVSRPCVNSNAVALASVGGLFSETFQFRFSRVRNVVELKPKEPEQIHIAI